PTMVRRPTMVRPGDTMVHQATTKTNSASVIRRSSVALLEQSFRFLVARTSGKSKRGRHIREPSYDDGNHFGGRLDDWRQNLRSVVNALNDRHRYDGIYTFIKFLAYPSEGRSEARCRLRNLQSIGSSLGQFPADGLLGIPNLG